MILLGFLLSFMAFGSSPPHWDQARSIRDRHEFIADNVEVIRPEESWQLLFAVTYVDADLRSSKDCLYYRIPGSKPGELKIRTMALEADCHREILSPGKWEQAGVSKLRLKTTPSGIRLDFSVNQKATTWEIFLPGAWKKPEPKLLLSSADYRSPRLIYLAPKSGAGKVTGGLADKVLCHDVGSDCREKSPSRCSDCANGFREIPNGCLVGPKVCGFEDCGGKDQAACRRGYVWQRKDLEFDCRTEASFAFCQKGFRISCDGDRAYCR